MPQNQFEVINAKVESEPSLEDLRTQAESLRNKISEKDREVESLTGEITAVPEARQIPILEKKQDSVKNNKEFDTINKQIEQIFKDNPGLSEKISKRGKLRDESKKLGDELYKINTKIRKLETLAARDEFLNKTFIPLRDALKENIDINYTSLEAYEYKVKHLTEQAGMKLDAAYKTLSNEDQARIGILENAISEKEAFFERLTEVEKILKDITGDEARGDSLSWPKGEVSRIERDISGKRLLEIL